MTEPEFHRWALVSRFPTEYPVSDGNRPVAKMNTNSETKQERHYSRGIAGGTILITVGIIILLTRWMEIGSYLILVVGAAFLAGGALTSKACWIIPGGVLSGIGLGIFFNTSPWSIPAASPNGLFLLSFAAGWFLITLTTGLFTARTQWWPIVPGSIMAVLGAAGLWREDAYLLQNCSGWLVPSFLILVGGYLLARSKRGNNS
jgi:hypothetical protein